MRKVWQTERQNQAYAATHALGREGIFGQLRYERDEGYSLWIFDDDLLKKADQIVKDLQRVPNLDFQGVASGWQHEEHSLMPVRISRAPEVAEEAPVFLDRVVTLLVMFVCCGFYLVTYDDKHEEVREMFMIGSRFLPAYTEIMQGQVWRLLTPVFLHGGFLHLLFNMMWYFDLGSQFEENEGSGKALLFLVVVGVLCNVAQYAISGPLFVGLSGVIYALLGYVWIQSRYGMKNTYHIEPQTMVFMMIWLAICVVGIIPRVANTQHIAGLILGGALAALQTKAWKIWLKRKK